LDNANTFDKWVNYELLERLIRFVVMPRRGYKPIDNAWYFKEPHIYLHEDPNALEVSSSEIREILLTKSFPVLNILETKKMDPKVLQYIISNKLYGT